jgi:putative glutamine amidotransferase
MSQPLIGITAGHSKNKHGLPQIHLLRTYVDATVAAGGVPVLLPPELSKSDWKLLYRKLDGIILSGGADMDPATFHGDAHPTIYGTDSERDALEIKLTRQVVDDEKPFLAICRGFQVLNVALGGTLYTHISEQFNDKVQHDTNRECPRDYLAHDVKVEEGTHLSKILGEPILKVNSWHHQGVKDIPPMLEVTAHSPDGLVEGLEIPTHPYAIAVQWHPEWMPQDPAMRNLFKTFIDASANNH